MKSGFKQFKLEEWIRSDDDLVALLNDALASANQKFPTCAVDDQC